MEERRVLDGRWDGRKETRRSRKKSRRGVSEYTTAQQGGAVTEGVALTNKMRRSYELRWGLEQRMILLSGPRQRMASERADVGTGMWMQWKHGVSSECVRVAGN